MAEYDAIVLGAGLSGLSAAIRLAYGGRKVAVFERHFVCGGLNSYYKRHGVFVDVGLHAMTNMAPESERSAPINKLFRQLKLKRAELQLMPQSHSEIRFPGATLCMDNDIETLHGAIAARFPQDSDNFRRLCDQIRGYSYAGDEIPDTTARRVLAERLSSPMLREMLLCPVFFYGNPMQEDMEFKQFCIMFKSLFLEGMGRPLAGMQPLIFTLQQKLEELGGHLFLRKGVQSIGIEQGRAVGVTLDTGEFISADVIISSAGALETGRLCSESVPALSGAVAGDIGFVETMFGLDCHPSALGINASIIFRNETEVFDFRTPASDMDLRSQIICFPGNFNGCQDIPAAKSVRITSLASPQWWMSLGPEAYREAKIKAADRLKGILAMISPELPGRIVDMEVSTPKTVLRFTGHENGAIYGSPTRFYPGETGCSNLFLCGTDQGFLGIIGSMMSGTVMANQIMVKWHALVQ